MFEQLRSIIRVFMRSRYHSNILFFAVFNMVCLLLLFYITYRAKVLTNLLKFTLRLMLHCPANVLVRHDAFISVLSGNFSTKSNETVLGDDFFKQVVYELPDGILISNDSKIRTVNKSSRCHLGEKVPENVIMFFKQFDNPSIIQKISTEKVFDERIVIQKEDKTESTLEVRFNRVNEGCYLYSEMQHNKLCITNS